MSFAPGDILYNQYNFDPVIFAWNMDPKTMPGRSPYEVFGNNPVLNVDPMGDSYTYSVVGNQIIVNVVVHTVGASDIMMQQMQSSIEKLWGNNNSFLSNDNKKYNLKINVEFKPQNNLHHAGISAKEGENILYYQNENRSKQGRDFVQRGSLALITGDAKSAPHEFGHLLGLADQYFDVYQYKYGFGSSQDIKDYIISGRNYNNVHKNDIMGIAGGSNNQKVLDRHIELIGNFILNRVNKSGESTGTADFVEYGAPSLGEPDNKTKVESGETPPPIIVTEDIQN